MFAQVLANRLARAGAHYGWALVAIVFLMALTTAGCMGLDWMATLRLSATHFERERADVVYGWVFAPHMIGAAVAAWGGGFFRSTFNTDLPAFYIAGFACLIAAAGVWLIGRTQGAREQLIEARA